MVSPEDGAGGSSVSSSDPRPQASVPARLRRVTLAEMSLMTRSASNLFDAEASEREGHRRVTFGNLEDDLRAKSVTSLFTVGA